VLTIIPEAYGEEKGQMRASLTRALAAFVKANPDVDRGRMLQVLENVDPLVIEKDARSFVGIKGGTHTAAMVEALERLYKSAGRKGAS
jgi:hypothetical protein